MPGNIMRETPMEFESRVVASAEIAGFDSKDNAVVGQAVLTAAAIEVETGRSAADAYSNRGAQYAVKLTLTALRQMGLIVADIDEREFTHHITSIEHQTLPVREWRQ